MCLAGPDFLKELELQRLCACSYVQHMRYAGTCLCYVGALRECSFIVLRNPRTEWFEKIASASCAGTSFGDFFFALVAFSKSTKVCVTGVECNSVHALWRLSQCILNEVFARYIVLKFLEAFPHSIQLHDKQAQLFTLLHLHRVENNSLVPQLPPARGGISGQQQQERMHVT